MKRLVTAVTASVAVVGISMATATSAVAEDKVVPGFSGEIVFEVQNDYAFDSDDPAEERNELGALVEPNLFFHATENIYLNAGLTFEAVQDAQPGDDRFFDDHGLFVQVLTLNAEFGGLHGPQSARGAGLAVLPFCALGTSRPRP